MKVTIVSPTFNERENVDRLAEAAHAVLRESDYELLFVDDDSPDRTWERVEEIGRGNPRVRLLRRMGRRSLSQAVIDGFSDTGSEFLACIDADLQHDPGILRSMLHAISDGCDLVVGSRYVEGGEVKDWVWSRRLQSRVATKLALLLLGIKLSDPMSGFFMMRRRDFLLIREKLSGNGFKILLEVLAALRPAKICEIPYRFGPRTAGKSKLSSRVMIAYLYQLWRLSRVGLTVSGRSLKTRERPAAL
jgi:dolichol-phosphate mannosyltransferase